MVLAQKSGAGGSLNFVDFLPLLAAILLAAAILLLGKQLAEKLARDARAKIVKSLPNYTVNPDGSRIAAEVADKRQTMFYRLANRLANSRYRTYLRTKLEMSGKYGQEPIIEVLYQKGLYGIAGFGLGSLMMMTNPQQGIWYFIGLPIAGFLVPDLLLYNNSQKRTELMNKSLPDAIDMLNLCVGSGLTFESALSRVSVGLKSPVAEELGVILGDMQLGKSRSEALNAALLRIKSDEFNRVLSALLQVDRLGVPVSQVLTEQANEMRSVRKDRAREKAQQVTIKVLMPLMLCLLPAMMVIVIGPSVMNLITGLGGM